MQLQQMEESLNKFITKKAGNLVIAIMLVIGMFFLADGIRVEAAVSTSRAERIKIELKDLINKVNQNYYEGVDIDRMLNKVLEEADDQTDINTISKKFVQELNDPYSVYYTKKELESFNNSMKGEYYGIGVEITKDKATGGILINRVFPNGPAEKAKLKKGDIILKAGNKNLTKLGITEASTYVKGEKGTKITLTILRGKSKKKIKVERNEVIMPSVFSKTYNKGRIGYIKVTAFLENTAKEFIKTLDKFEKNSVEGVVIDLRDNGGGFVGTAYNMLNRILPSGETVFSFQYGNGEVERHITEDDSLEEDKVFDIPICIIINKNTASASEIFSGALRDNGYAEIVGETSYGKGVAQSVFEIYGNNDDTVIGGLKLTTMKYYLPDGESINKIGITPDYKVKDNKKTVKDEQLEKALKEIRKIIE